MRLTHNKHQQLWFKFICNRTPDGFEALFCASRALWVLHWHPTNGYFCWHKVGTTFFPNPLHVGEVPKSVMHSIASSPVLPGMTNIGDAWHDMICCRTPKKMSNLGDEVIISPANRGSEGGYDVEWTSWQACWRNPWFKRTFLTSVENSTTYPTWQKISIAVSATRASSKKLQGQPWSSKCYVALDGSCWIFCLWHLFRQGRPSDSMWPSFSTRGSTGSVVFLAEAQGEPSLNYVARGRIKDYLSLLSLNNILLLVICFLIFESWFTEPPTRCNGFLWSDGPRRGAHHFCFAVRGNRRRVGGLELKGHAPTKKSGLKGKHNNLIKTYFNRKYIFPSIDFQKRHERQFSSEKRGFGRLLWFPSPKSQCCSATKHPHQVWPPWTPKIHGQKTNDPPIFGDENFAKKDVHHSAPWLGVAGLGALGYGGIRLPLPFLRGPKKPGWSGFQGAEIDVLLAIKAPGVVFFLFFFFKGSEIQLEYHSQLPQITRKFCLKRKDLTKIPLDFYDKNRPWLCIPWKPLELSRLSEPRYGGGSPLVLCSFVLQILGGRDSLQTSLHLKNSSKSLPWYYCIT